MDEIKGIVRRVLEGLQPGGTNERQQIVLTWQKALVAKYKKHCRIVDFRNNRLLVNVDSSNWLYQLNLRKEKLIKKLNKQLKKDIIKDIYFKLGNTKN